MKIKNNYDKIINLLKNVGNLKDALIFDAQGNILSQTNSVDNKLPVIIPHLLETISNSRIRTDFGELHAISIMNSKYKIMFLKLPDHQIYISLCGNQNMNSGLVQYHLPKIIEIINKSNNNNE